MSAAYGLVVTGKAPLARKYQQALDKAGFIVQVVTTGARAQVQLAFTSPDLVVLDMSLPDIPGEIILRQIQAHSRLDDTHLILISASPQTAKSWQRVPRERIFLNPIPPADLSALAIACIPAGDL